MNPDEWRRLKWPEIFIAYQLNFHVDALKMMGVRVAVGNLQGEKGRQLLDLTWAEALEAFREELYQGLEKAEEFFSGWGKKDRREVPALKDFTIGAYQDLLSRTEEEYQRWLEESRSGFTGEVQEAYTQAASGYYANQDVMREKSSEQGRTLASKTREKLDTKYKSKVKELRQALHIPAKGYQDLDQAARWLYDRWPRDGTPGPDEVVSLPYARHRGQIVWNRPPMQIPVLVKASRELGQGCSLPRSWDPLLWLYLLRGKLEPLPAQSRTPEWSKMTRAVYVVNLLNRHPAEHVALIYNFGLPEQKFVEIRGKAKAKGALQKLCYDEGWRLGRVRSEEDQIDYADILKIKQRWYDKYGKAMT